MSLPRPQNEYEIDPTNGTITQVTGDNIGATPSTVNIGGSEYYLNGNRLYSVEGPVTDFYQLGSAGPSTIVEWPGYGAILVNQIQRSNINSIGAEGRLYGVSGGVTVLMADGTQRSLDMPFVPITKQGMRLTVSVNDEGQYEYNPNQDYGTNAALQQATGDPDIRYATPTEAIQRAIFNYLRDKGAEIVQEYIEQVEEGQDIIMSPYDAILALLQNVTTNLSFGSKIFVAAPGSTYSGQNA